MEQELPPELLQRVSLEELRPWLQELRRTSELRLPDCCGCLTVGCVLYLPCLWLPYCCCEQRCDRRWSHALWDWQQRLNAQLLIPRGLHAQTRSHCRDYTVARQDGFAKNREIRRWLAVALTAREVRVLQAEPLMSGDVEPPCCGFESETALVMHP